MHLGFSYMSLLFLVLLFLPNALWTRHKPAGYDELTAHENKLLLFLERVGQAAVTCLVLIFSDFDPQGWSFWLLWLLLACAFMALYEVFWLRYFRSGKALKDFYSGLLGIPVAGATLPVLAFLCLAVYGKNAFLFAAVVILGIGHIGVHLRHFRELDS